MQPSVWSVSVLLFLTSCAAPLTVSPRATPEEIADEQQRQIEFVRTARAAGFVHEQQPSEPAGPRIKAVAARIAPAAVAFCRDLGLRADPRDCGLGIKLAQSRSLNAYADGDIIYITSRMVRFTQTEDELAFIVAHEAAHNIMGHLDAQRGNAVMGGMIGALATGLAASYGVYDPTGVQAGSDMAVLSYSSAYEQEADYIGLYLLARAGYDYHGVADFWRRMSLENPKSIYLSSTHPSNAERYVVMRKDIAEIDVKREQQQALLPGFLPAELQTVQQRIFQQRTVQGVH